MGVLACALVLAILWRIKAGILPGLELHILGVTAVTLILGWRLAIFASSLASLLLGVSRSVATALIACAFTIYGFFTNYIELFVFCALL